MKKLIGPLLAIALCGALLSYGVGQEIPVGRLTGHVTMKENGKPLAGALVTATLKGTPDDDRPRVKGVETDDEGNYSFRGLPAGDYELSVSAEAHSKYELVTSVTEGKASKFDIKADPSEPYLNLYASQKVFTPGEKPRLELHGFVANKEVSLRVIRLDEAEIARHGSYEQSLGPLARQNDGDKFGLAKIGTKVLEEKSVVGARDAEGTFVHTLPLPQLKEGAYFVSCWAGEQRTSAVLLVSNLALVTKTGADGALVFASDLSTGQPVEGAEVLVRKGDILAPLGQTDRDGLLQTDLPEPVENRSTLLARKGSSMALVDVYRSENDRSDVWISAYCERPAYRPGDTVSFKGFVRRVDGDGYRLPNQGSVKVDFNDPDGLTLKSLTLPISAHGSFHAEFPTSKETKPGGYNIVCKAFGGESRGVFANIVAYRKPEFSIEVTPDKDHVAMGQRASATIECKYYYGGPVVGAKVKASIYRSPAYTYEGEDGEETYGDSYGGGDYSEDVEAVTDAAGRAHVEFETRGENDPEVMTNDYIYTVSASVTEDGGRYFDGEGQVHVTRGDLGLHMDLTNPILAVGDTADVVITTTDPLDSKKPIANRPVTVEVGREAYTDKASVFVPQNSFTATTGPDGKVHVSIPITRAVSLTFRAQAKDDAGRTVVAQEYAWVAGSPSEAQKDRGDLQVTLDRSSYKEGQPAKAMIQTDMPGGAALVTLQTDRVLWRKVVELANGATMVQLPVSKEYAPNVYVSVAYVREKKFLQAERRMRVEREDRRLRVEVTPAKDTYLPGESAEVKVRTLDETGKPVPAEISVGVVDRGIYDVASDDTDLYASLYPERNNGVQTAYSFPEIYLDGGDKGSAKVPLRKNFRDTAAWVPTVWTGPSGEATVPFTLPDNLTEWRVTAVGLSDASQAGKSIASFRVRKPLMVRLGLPQFLVEGDHQRLTAVITNDTGRDADVNLELGTSGLHLSGEAKRTVRVPADAPQTVELEVDATDVGNASVTARAWIDGGANDGVQQSFPVLAHGRPVLVTKAGEGRDEFTLKLPEDYDPKVGTLKVTVSPTLAGDLSNALNGLIDYPYGCVEQTMSRFMPAVLVDDAVRKLGLTPPSNLDKLPTIVSDSLARLDRMRHPDGGWGWWEYDQSEPFMTALVLDGLDRAKRAGYRVDAAHPEQAVNWALEYLKDSKKSKDATRRDRLYLVYTLIRWGHSEVGSYLDRIDLKGHPATRRTPEDKVRAADLATASLAYAAAGRNPNPLLDRLIALARNGEESVDWGSEDGAWGEEPTALALVALETSRPTDARIPKIVRGLLDRRKGDGWNSTRDTAYALVGLTKYLSQTNELSAVRTVQVTVNGQTYGPYTLTAKSDSPSKTVEVPVSSLDRGSASIAVTPVGDARETYPLYYTAALSGFETTPKLEAKATDKGLEIERRMYKMEPRRDKDGEMRLLPSLKPITEYENGDIIRVELTIHSDVPRDFVMVEEPTPSSCRVTERTELETYEEKGWWWSRTVLMDDHVAFFARSLPKGESKITYHMRAEAAGKAIALPSRAGNMYDPGRWAATAEDRVEVTK